MVEIGEGDEYDIETCMVSLSGIRRNCERFNVRMYPV